VVVGELFTTAIRLLISDVRPLTRDCLLLSDAYNAESEFGDFVEEAGRESAAEAKNR